MANRSVSRRALLKTGAAATGGLALPTIFTAASVAAYTNEPTGPSVVFGFNVPLTGPYVDEGEDQLRAQQLAVDHLNGIGDGGCRSTFTSKALTGNGVLGKKVEFVTGDTQTRSDVARKSAKSMIENDGAVMIGGGSFSGVAIAVQDLCQQAGVVFMAGQTHSNDVTGRDRKANGFRHFFNAQMSADALAPVLATELGRERRAYHLTADYNWGRSQEKAMVASTEAVGWETVKFLRTTLATTDFSPFMPLILESGADVLVLNHYGGSMVNALVSAMQFGLRDQVANGRDFRIVVPLVTELTAAVAGESIKGVMGSVNWNWQLQDEGTKAFVNSFQAKYGKPPSNAAQTCYAQTLLYADACERAGTFNPCGVIKALEDFEFGGLGNGPTLYRGADHQCFKDVPVVQGSEAPTNAHDTLQIVGVTPRAQVTYDPGHPMFDGGFLGTCNSGA